MKELLFRRQYLISTKKLELSNSINFLETSFSDFHVYRHKDCQIKIIESGTNKIMLLGFIYSTENPNLTTAEILQKVLNCSDKRTLFKETDSLIGRWALFVKLNNETFAFNDATGAKQIFYFENEETKVLSSSENLIAKTLNLKVDSKITEQYSKPLKNVVNAWWPGILTPYEGVKALIPNYYLDIQKLSTFRFWPYQEFKLSRNHLQTFEEIDRLIKNGIQALIEENKEACLALTSGLDSRLSLAYCKPFIDKIEAFTVKFDTENKTYKSDFEIPKKLSESFNFRYKLYNAPQKVPEDFIEVFNQNSSTKKEFFQKFNYSLFENYPEGKILIGGVISQIARRGNTYRPYTAKAKDLANMSPMGENNIVLKYFDLWLESTTPILKKFNYKIEDALFIEMKMGRLNGVLKAESDIVHDTYEPLNSRNILALIYSLPPKVKFGGYNPLYKHLIEKNWKELMSIYSPSNRPYKRKSLKIIIRQYLKLIKYKTLG